MRNQEAQAKDMGVNSDDDLTFPLPGFRFHPTDEELVDFYLRRKVEKKTIIIDLIKQLDIYKFDPWELPKPSSAGEKESYFYSKRGRKYRNSVRPNRVTSSGFWKATGIDKPVYSDKGEAIIGLKKTLVYYRGSAGKGTKTDWMMHEFRLPGPEINLNHNNSIKSTTSQEAEVWTLCRIFKRNLSSRKYTPDWRELATTKRVHHQVDSSSKQLIQLHSQDQESYIHFGPAPNFIHHNPVKPITNSSFSNNYTNTFSSSIAQQPTSTTSSPSFANLEVMDDHDFFGFGSYDELRSVVDCALNPFHM